MARPIIAWQTQLEAGQSVAANADTTVTMLPHTGDWEINVGFKVQFSRVSSDPFVEVYQSLDGTANYDTVPLTAFSISRVATGVAQVSVRLPAGQYALRYRGLTSQDATSFFVPTYWVVTAIT